MTAGIQSQTDGIIGRLCAAGQQHEYS